MATAILPNTTTSNSFRMPVDDRHGWGYALLLALIATLFLRPADLIPALDDWPIYQFLILACLGVSARPVIRTLGGIQLYEQPLTACLILLLLAVGISHLAHGFLWGARMSMYTVGKLLVLYLLITCLVNTAQRLALLLRCLTFAITLVAALALLDRYEFVSIAALESIQDRGASNEVGPATVDRIRGTGIFQDPNDFGQILVIGLVLCASFLFKPQVGWPRHLWLVPACLLLSTLALTHSRGALLSLICAVPAVLIYQRRGSWGLQLLMGLPLLALVFSSRMTDFNAVNTGTGQSRIQIWSESLTVWRYYPFFGLGEGLLVDEIGVVAHNSFLQCFAELGLLGGTIFVACFVAAAHVLFSLRTVAESDDAHAKSTIDPQELSHCGSFLFAALVAYAVGMLTISRQFVAPTYLILGLTAASQCLLAPHVARWQIGNRFLAITIFCSLASLVAFYLAVRLLVSW